MRQESTALEMPAISKRKPRRKTRKQSLWNMWLNRVLAWLKSGKLSGKERRLHVRETVSFGEKRFAAVVEYEGHSFLIGGTASSICLLSDLAKQSFATTLTERSKAAGNE